MKKRIIYLSLCALLFTNSISAYAANISRLGGTDRYETAKLINNKMNSKTLILVSGTGFADALSSTSLIKYYDAEIHLVKQTLDSNTISSLNNGEFEQAIIVGGTGVISSTIESQLKNKLGSNNVERLGGIDRYETSSLVAKKVTSLSSSVPYTFIVSGKAFPDALSVASVAAMTGSPIVLSNGTTISSGGLASVNKTSDTVYKLGGPTIIGNTFDSKIGSYERLFGIDRYETNKLICNEFKELFSGDEIFVASGLNFPDALAGSALAAKEKAPIVFVSSKAEESAKDVVKSLNKPNLTVLGGSGVVSDSIIENLLSNEKSFEDSINEEILRLVNIERSKVGISPLSWSNSSAPYAEHKSDDMYMNNYFSHADLSGKFTYEYMRADGVAFNIWGENIAKSYFKKNSTYKSIANELVQGWMQSKGHRENILNASFNEIGIGCSFENTNSNSIIYATQIFINN